MSRSSHLTDQTTVSFDDPFQKTFITQLRKIDPRSREFIETLDRMLGSREGVDTAMSLEGVNAVVLVNILDQVLEAGPKVPRRLWQTSSKIIGSICGRRSILPRSCDLTDEISKSEGYLPSAFGEFANVWKGRYDGSPVCVKALRRPFRHSAAKQRLFEDIVVWKRLSHPNLLSILGASVKLSKLCVVTEWMDNGNIMEFTSKHPDANRLRLLAGAASGLQHLHDSGGLHGDIKPTNILIDRDFQPRVTDYILMANIRSTLSTPFPSDDNVRYAAPELLDSSGFGLDDGNLTENSDIYAFGMVTYQVITGQQPFPGAKKDVVKHNIITGDRPKRPLGPHEWLSDDVWDFISWCWSPSWDRRPDAKVAMNTLNNAADIFEGNRGQSVAVGAPGETPSHFGPVNIYPAGRDQSGPSTPTPGVFTPTSPFIAKTPTGSGAARKLERKKHKQKESRIWSDSAGLHLQEATLVGYKDGTVHLSSSDGTALEIPEVKLSSDDLAYIQTQDVYKKAKHKSSHHSLAITSWPSIRRQYSMQSLAQYLDPRGLESQLRQDPVPPSPRASASFVDLPESWEMDLITFLRVSGTGAKSNLDREKAQEFANWLDTALAGGDPHQQKREEYVGYLRELCGSFGIVPSSFLVEPTFEEVEATPFAFGGSSDVYPASFEGRRVATKALRISNNGNLERARKLLVKEVVRWKWLQHENILPFIGVTFAPRLFLVMSEWVENGDIMRFTANYPDYNRIHLLIGAVTGLEYLHEHGIVHGNLKGASILVDSDYRARLADFGLVEVINESAAGSKINNSRIGGTTRWMAPELMYPEKFGFTRDRQAQLPSTGTDVYALGMTILEVITGCHPFSDITLEAAVMCKVLGGGRPDRPSSGFTDQLWELVVATWFAEHGSQLPERPQTSTIIEYLNEEVNNWGTTIIPPPVLEITEDDAFGDTLTNSSIYFETPTPSRTPTVDPGGTFVTNNTRRLRD